MHIAPAGQSIIPGAETEPRSIPEAAEAFEALFVGQILKSAREAGNAGFGEGDNAGGTMMELAEEHLAREIARGGGCGLAKAVIQQLQSGSFQAEQTNGSRSDSDSN